MKNRSKRLLSMLLAFGFLLGIRNGRLALWRDGDAHPEQSYDIRADTLPPADRLRLRQGIRVQTREEVWQLLENYFD